jgi:hypothetical protein
MNRTRLLIALVALGALLLGACDSSDDEPITEPSSPGSIAMGPGISVADALASDLDEPLLVNGFIVATSADVRLCELLAESFPPQCGGAYLVIEGLDLTSVDGLEEASGVRWTNGFAPILGSVEGSTLTVDSLSSS